MTWHDGSHPLENFAIPENLFLHRVLFIFLAFSARFFHQCPIKSFIYICITSILKICCDLLKNICNRFVGLDSDRPKKKRRKLTKDDIELVYASAQGSKLKGTVPTAVSFTVLGPFQKICWHTWWPVDPVLQGQNFSCIGMIDFQWRLTILRLPKLVKMFWASD